MATDSESPSRCDTSYLLQMSEALDDKGIVEKFQKIMSPVVLPIMDALNQANSTIASLQQQLQEKDIAISNLQSKVCGMELRLDDLEQLGRQGSMRVFGIPEVTPGTVDDKVSAVCNDQMKVKLKLTIEDLEVVHRVGKPPPSPSNPDDTKSDVTESSDATTTKPHPILVKFSCRRTKARVMKNKKHLKDNLHVSPDGNITSPVYVADDLTKWHTNLSYRARLLKHSGKIADIWTFDSKILVKSLHNHEYCWNQQISHWKIYVSCTW